MAFVSTIVEDKNAQIQIELLSKYNSEFISCTQIAYYVDDDLLFKKPGTIMINRRGNYPKLQILSPDTGNYTAEFQENSCVFTDLCALDMIKIETSYIPNKINKMVDIKVIITF